jgi:hypothetical protein
MRKKITLISLFIAFSSSRLFSQTPTFQSVLNNTAGSQSNQIFSVVKDNNNNLFFCGTHSDTIQLGGVTLLPGQGGAFLGKMDPAGNVMWMAQGGTAAATNDKAYGIDVDQNGDVYVCGAISGFQTASFNGVQLPSMFPGFVVKYNNNGNFIWASGMGANIYSIAIDNLNVPVINSGDNSIYKLDPITGVMISSPYGIFSGNIQNPLYHSICIDASNNIIVQGGNKIVKFDSGFNQLWSTAITSSLIETFRINLDPAGNVFGTFYGLFGTVTIGTITKSNFPNGYIYKLDAATGNPLFVDSLLIGGNASKIREVIESAGNYYVSGDGAFNTPVVLKVSSAYSLLWQSNLDSHSPVNDLELISEDCLMLAGRHDATVTLGTYTLNLPNGITNTDNSFIAGLCDGNLGVLSNDNSGNISFYPNPASNKIYIEVKNNSSISGIELYNLYGEKVLMQKFTNEMDLSHLEKGIYFLLVKNGQSVFSGKIVLQ